MSTQPGKDTIYIDVDDEITAIIDKVRGSHEKIVALVLPKRATVLQSIVNMKLLKRTADESKKHLVLITGEAGLMPLAGSVGIYVAKTLQSKPEVPSGPVAAHDNEDQEEAVNMADDLDGSNPVGEHMRHAPASVVRPAAAADDDQPIELDNTTPTPAGPVVGHGNAEAAKKAKKGGKKFSIPDFNKFRLWGVVAGVAVVVFIVMWYLAFVVMPSASISVKTDSTALQESFEVSLSTAATEVNAEDSIVPAQSQQTQKTVTQQAETTGQKDKGSKSSGTVTMTARRCGAIGQAPNVPAGTGLSANSLTFITQKATSFSIDDIDGNCIKFVANDSTPVIAQGNGANYNLSGTFTVAGRTDVTATGSTSGGTSNIVKVVAQSDIDNLKQKITTQDTSSIKRELQQSLTGRGLYAIDGSFFNAEPEVITNVKVGDEAPAVTITQKTTYTMLGAKQDDLKKVIAAVVDDKIDKNKQQILDYGLDKATFKLQNQRDTTTLVTMNVTAIAGTDIDLQEITKQVAGKKSNDAKEIIGKYPGVTEVSVNYSPFWVSSIPKKASKIHITVEKPSISNAD
jgi:hypothetical protein